jgi:hypothetical protein
MPLNKKYSKPLPEELTKDLYRVTKKIKLPAPEHLLRKYNVQLGQISFIPIEGPYH